MTSLANSQNSLLSASVDWLGRYLFPEQCFGCHAWAKGYLCCKCKPPSGPIGRQFPWGQVVSLGSYQGCIKDFVLHWKEFGSQRICRETALHLSPVLLSMLKDERPAHRPLIIPVPASSSRSRFRGHRPVENLAVQLSQMCRLDCDPHLLTTPHDFSERKHMNLVQRLSDIEQRYQCEKNSGDKNRLVVLLDDVVTSGETLRRAQLALHQAGYARVRCLTFAATL